MKRLTSIKPRIHAADLSRAKLPPKTADAYYLSPEWKALRHACLTRDGFRCTACGEPAFIADHIISRRRWAAESRPGSPDTLANLQSRCRTCDNRTKEDAFGNRRNGGVAGVIGPDGFPVA